MVDVKTCLDNAQENDDSASCIWKKHWHISALEKRVPAY